MAPVLITIAITPVILVVVTLVSRWGQREREKVHPWKYILAAVGVQFIFWWLLPATVHSHRWGASHVGFFGVALSVAAAGVGILAFARCPFRQWFAKTVSTLIMFGALYGAVFSIGSYWFRT